MRCIFCKTNLDSSTSVEHIVPRSLGHNEHVLEPGVVCDSCNNYFASKVEGRVLASNFFRDLRFRNNVPSKKGRVPPAIGCCPSAGVAIEFRRDTSGLSIGVRSEEDEAAFVAALQSRQSGSLWLPIIAGNDTDARVMARFLGKMAMECLASCLTVVTGGQDEIVDHSELEPLRRFVRYGEGPDWYYTERRIYPEGEIFQPDSDPEAFEVLHEFDLLYTEEKELYFVCAIFGIEFAINMGGPSTDSYNAWLNAHNGGSILLDERLKPNLTKR